MHKPKYYKQTKIAAIIPNIFSKVALKCLINLLMRKTKMDCSKTTAEARSVVYYIPKCLVDLLLCQHICGCVIMAKCSPWDTYQPPTVTETTTKAVLSTL